MLYSVLGVLCVAWSLSQVKLASALIVKGLRKGENAKQDMLVLGKFGLVRFEALFAKPETKPFSFFQIF